MSIDITQINLRDIAETCRDAANDVDAVLRPQRKEYFLEQAAQLEALAAFGCKWGPVGEALKGATITLDDDPYPRAIPVWGISSINASVDVCIGLLLVCGFRRYSSSSLWRWHTREAAEAARQRLIQAAWLVGV